MMRTNAPEPNSARRVTSISLMVLVLLSPMILEAQRIDTIRTNPDAILLRRIWTQRGNGIGNAVAAMPDLNGDGRAEFAVQHRAGDWLLISLDSSLQSQEIWRRRAASPQPLAAARLFGPDKWALIFPREKDTSDRTLFAIDIYRIDSGLVVAPPAIEWSSTIADTYLLANQFRVADLDQDGADELIVVAPVTQRGSVVERNGEIWIYRGGSRFQMDTPTVVIRDAEHHANEYNLHIGKLDGDEYPDLIATTFNGGRIRWGGSDLTALDRPVDRRFTMASTWIHPLDADGDGRSDFLSDGLPMQVMLHLSSSGKNPRTRSFDERDADRTFVGRGNNTFVAGPLNDSADIHDMFATNSALGDNAQLFFSGSSDGPDARYEAYYNSSRDGLPSGDPIGPTIPAGDVDGNGWPDLLAGRVSFSGGGIALILGGGPHIPRDSMPASAIRDIALDGHRDAITVWPNPASDVVHIAWRGDLGRTPARFTVHDALGQLVAAGSAEQGRGEVAWSCAGRPSGLYILSVLDRHGTSIVIVPVIKH